MQVVGRIEIRQVVEIGRRAQQAELDPVDVVAALDEAAPRVGVRQVGADFQIVGQAVRAAEANRVPGILVVIADDNAVVVVLLARQIERRAVVAARDRQIVLDDAPGGIRFVGMIVDR
jgi:hypothetical protein